VTVVAVVFVPAAPLMIPQVAGGSAALDSETRDAILATVARALADGPDQVVIVAPSESAGEWPSAATWDFAGFGVTRRPPDPRTTLPWPLGIGAWLLDECGWDGERGYLAVDGSAVATAAGETVPDHRRTVILAVGDGSACRSERAPGHLDERAEPFDDRIAALLAAGDAQGLGELDETLAGELLCAGAPVWRWVATALAGRRVVGADLVTHVAPYGVGYFVAQWSVG
jgi:hypothetical protein